MGRLRHNLCFVTGTRAEFGLMRSVLEAVQEQPGLRLRIIATGMHLDRRHGRSLDAIREAGWKVDATVDWPPAPRSRPEGVARSTGLAMAGLAEAITSLKSDIVLVVGDRVEAFAAAAAGHVAGCAVAHVHGGDRALGQIDDSLRHAITKLAHVHFPATRESARRIRRLGEDDWRIVTAGSPGIDGITDAAATYEQMLLHFGMLRQGRFALLVLHPTEADDPAEQQRAERVLRGVLAAGVDRVCVVYPNNDPGSRGIIAAWEKVKDDRVVIRKDVPRPLFLALMRESAVMVGNSSSGIIEAASFGTPVIDLGSRQQGRQRTGNVRHVEHPGEIEQAVRSIWNGGRPARWRGKNVYGEGGAGRIIAGHLAHLAIDDRLLRKIIAY